MRWAVMIVLLASITVAGTGCVAAAVAAACAASCAVAGGVAAGVAASDSGRQENREARVTLRIECGAGATCLDAVQMTLQGFDGVLEVNVDSNERRARVVFDPRRMTPERMVGAIEDLGYRARVEERS